MFARLVGGGAGSANPSPLLIDGGVVLQGGPESSADPGPTDQKNVVDQIMICPP